MRLVPFFDYKRLFKDSETAFLEVFCEVGQKGSFILQEELALFEDSLRRFINRGHSIGVGNATDGLELALMALQHEGGYRSGEVIISGHTMVATASAVKLAGLTPVPVGIGWDGLIDCSEIERAVNGKTIGIMPTHLNGRICNMTDILDLARGSGLFVLEDGAQALGARYKGDCIGFDVGSCISFYPAKTLGCLGDGGAFVTNMPCIAEQIAMLRDHGRDSHGISRCWGRNSRLDNLQAAFLEFQLQSYPKVIERRREIAALYCDLLDQVSQVSTPPRPDVGDRFDVYQNFEIRAVNRDGLREFLASRGVGTLIQWGGVPINRQRYLGIDFAIPSVDEFFMQCLMLPINMFISDEDVEYVVENIKEYYCFE